MTEPSNKHSGPPRLTVGQALTIAALLIFGFLALENGFSLVFLLIAMGTAALTLNRLLALVMWWVDRSDDTREDQT